jgi:mannose/cellobiose epimerase-like protein (N-acyl-D-glucosamine 2-epimerase family)
MVSVDKLFLEKSAQGLLDFGVNFPAPNGGSGWLNDDGTLSGEHGVETWITSRMIHSYSIAKLLGQETVNGKSTDALISAGLSALYPVVSESGEAVLYDEINGGWFAGVGLNGSQEGADFDQTKAAYAHAFVILAASSASLAGNEDAKKLLPLALTTFNDKFWDEANGLSVDNYPAADWSELDNYRGINANMHTVEAFLAASDVLRQLPHLAPSDEQGADLWLTRAGKIVAHVCSWAPDFGWRVPEHFSIDETGGWAVDKEFNADKKADQFKPYGATVGHGLEWSRLIVQYALAAVAAGLISEESDEYKTCILTAENLFNTAVAEGWDTALVPDCNGGDPAQRGGFYYTTDWTGQPVVKDRMHWVEAEGINAVATLFEVTGDPKYHDEFVKEWLWTNEFLADETGSWRHQLDENNNHISTVWPGKPDIYHALQACLIPLYNKKRSIASAVKAGEEGKF